VQKRVASGVLSAGHARALLALDSEEQMLTLAKRIVAEGLSVRSTEEIVALQKNDGTLDKPRKRSAQNYWKDSSLPQKLGDRFDTKVTIRGTEQKGRIEITFASQEDLQRISGLLVGGGNLKNSDADGWV
jgi:ParB family chromosome partitioning protein